jgi:sarcosine oxidase subunit gamma
VAELVARSPAAGLLPVTHGSLALTEIVPEAITSLAALRGAEGSLPPPNRSGEIASARLLWSGRNQALAIGPVPQDIPGLVATDQSDAFAILALSGAGAGDVLARLTPLDLAAASFRRGDVARSLLAHINALFHRTGPQDWEILVFRSMTVTAVHELERAMRSVTARSDIA